MSKQTRLDSAKCITLSSKSVIFEFINGILFSYQVGCEQTLAHNLCHILTDTTITVIMVNLISELCTTFNWVMAGKHITTAELIQLTPFNIGTGREFGDFLNSLDDLHEYLRLSYPRLRPPSYFCENENEKGLILHYRTKRNFLLWYTVGQIITVAKIFYSTDVEIELISEHQEINEYHFILQLSFENRAFHQRMQSNHMKTHRNAHRERLSPDSPLFNSAAALFGCPYSASRTASPDGLIRQDSATPPLDHQPRLPPISSELFFNIFPFTIVYDQSMTIRHIGNCLKASTRLH